MMRLLLCACLLLNSWTYSLPEAQWQSEGTGKTFCPSHLCDVNKCLPHQWVCDGEEDCHDGSDESDCHPSTCESDVDFQCANGLQCVPLKWQCDGDKDCHDGSDEHDCANVTCAENHVSCGPGNGCIHVSFVCDGHVDCPGGLDEKISTCKNKTCLNDEFQCRTDHRCITKRWQCDKDYDCDDQSDEENCPEPTCDEDHFQCRINTTQCIPIQWHCDGGYDCEDKTDEQNCEMDDESQQHCDEYEFLCSVSHECIHSSWRCDSDADCIDGSDEQGCAPPTCKADEFQCRQNGNCIPAHWKCDGNPQCDDRSDEDSCIRRVPCSPHTEFDCSRGRGVEPNCISVSKVCDGKNDCGAYEDENPGLCAHSNHSNPCNTRDKGGCMHNCVNTVLGHYCTCQPGYRLISDNQTCEDIDECSIPGSCSHLCNNTKGHFKCSCHEGYELDAVHHRFCLAKEEPSLIFANRHELREIRLRKGDYQLRKDGLLNTRTFDYDYSAGSLFWSDGINHTISWQFQDSSGTMVTEVLVSDGLKSVDGLAFDWIHKNLYWTDGGKHQIEVLGMKSGTRGRWRSTLITDLDTPKALVLDPRSQRYLMYWTECGKAPKIRSAYLDGTNIRDIVLSGSDILWPNGLTLDYEMNVLYWTDMKLHIIVSINVGAGEPNRKIVLTSYSFLRHPFSVTVFEDYLYWTDWQTESVLKVNKFSSNSANVTRVATRLNMPMDVLVFHRLRQPLGENVCEKRCSHICLPTYSYAHVNCTCPNSNALTSYKLSSDRTNCIVINSPEVPTESVSMSPGPEVKSSALTGRTAGHLAGIIIGVICVIAVIIFFGLYCVMKRHRKRNIKSMNFDNPVYRKRSEDQFSLEKHEYNPYVDMPDGVTDREEPFTLSSENYLMSDK